MKKPHEEEVIPTAIFNTENADREMQAQYGLSDTHHTPAFLYVERGPGVGQLLEVHQGVIVVGRASVSDLRIQHPSISRRHAQVKRVGEDFFVKDLGSQNGTFVNKQRIATEVAVQVGDTLAIGNALVRLRGPMTKAERMAATPAPKVRSSAVVASAPSRSSDAGRRSTSALRIAVFAGAMGFGLAGVVAFAVVKMVLAPTNAAPAATGPAVDKREAALAPAPKQESQREQLIKDALDRKMQEKAAVAAQPAVEEPTVAVEAVRVPTAPVAKREAAPVAPKATVAKAAPVVVASASKKAAAKTDDDDDDASSMKAGGKRSHLLAPYEKGNAEGALELAKKAGDKELTDKLTKFIKAYDTANDAMIGGNGAVAISSFTKALQLDEGLSSGWGKYGSEIRRQLGNLYTMVGVQHLSNGDGDKAKRAFEAALKHDGSNARARSNLDKLGAGGDGEEAPAKRTVIKKKQSIDDAFGD